MQDYIDMDTHEKIRYISESSNASTSGYSTMSPGGMHRSNNMSPASSILSSPAHSPATMLQTEFSNLNLPPNSPQLQYTTIPQNVYGNSVNYTSPNTMTGNMVVMQQQFPNHQQQQQSYTQAPNMQERKYTAELRILEQPVEKFRFRYKSEMHGTHGSLNGANSKRTPKTYPEVELQNFNGRAIIRCSLFQTNLDSPHSHQLVVRKDDTDICDPHDLHVSPEIGFVAQFQNMGIIHTAKKFIFEELLKKKMNRLMFDMGRDDLSTKQMQELHKATEKEAKDMNLNQVRLCFEAFKIEDDKTWSRIAAPVYTNPINNRKSAQTGELRITRLSIATGSVKGGDDLILLVEKVSKKNIKVRFYEQNDDDETVWEAFGRFRESDVHHQYAIVCQTPPYRNKDIDKPVEVNIELVRPSDDERSFPPVIFRYKPNDSAVSRKRRRTCSTATSSSGSGSSVNSFEVPKTIQEQQQQQQQQQQPQMNTNIQYMQTTDTLKHPQTISEEFDKDALLRNAQLEEVIMADSAELFKMCLGFPELGSLTQLSKEGFLEMDGVATTTTSKDFSKISIFNKLIETTLASSKSTNSDLERIFKIYDETRNAKQLSEAQFSELAKKVANIYTAHAEKNENGDTLIHEIIINDNARVGIKLCHILTYFKQIGVFNRVLNANNESGLHYACLYDRALYIRPLLGLGCDPNIQDKQGNTALHVAVREQHSKCVESLLNVKNVRLDLTLRNDDGLTPLHIAVEHNSKDIAKKLLEYNPIAALSPNGKESNNALHVAVRQQSLDLVKLILNTSSIDKQTILMSRNAAGCTAFNIAKGLNTKIGNQMASLLSPADSDEEPGNLVIKEEEMSSSSADEDDTEEAVTLNENTIKTEFVNNERLVTIESTENKKNIDNRLAELLSNEKKFHKIAKLLNDQFKWRRLAENIKLQRFLCLWSSAEDLLTYIKNKQSINYENFVSALAQVDRDALDVLLMPLQ